MARNLRLRAVLCLWMVVIALAPLSAQTASAAGALAGRTIVIDPGHGGFDSGALGNNLQEKDLTLAIGLQTGAQLAAQGAHIVFTRTSDVTVGSPGDITGGLATRSAMANAAHANLYISIHANSLNDPGYAGVMTFYGSKDGYIDNVSRSPALVSQSHLLAQDVQVGVVHQTGAIDRGVQSADFYVLGNTSMPSILIETGFITNANEANALNSRGYQAKIASGIVSGVERFFGSVGTPVQQQVQGGLDGTFLADVTLPDHTDVTPGQTVTKSWRISNTGTQPWNASDQLVLQPGGNFANATASKQLPSVAVGNSIVLTASVTVPAGFTGVATATWRMEDANGTPFGDPLWVVLDVPDQAFSSYWVETIRRTVLWTNADPHADAITSLGQWTYLKVMSPQDGNRLEVYEPVTHDHGFVDAYAVGPSGSPPSGYVLPAATPPFQAYWVRTAQLAALRSGASDPAVIFGYVPAGTLLYVVSDPHGPRLLVRNPATGGLAYIDASAMKQGVAPATQPSVGGNGQTYTVQAGDSLSAIAVRFGVTQAALLAANKLTDANSIIVGQTLTIPGGNQNVSTQSAAPTQTYTVQAGDTLSAIAVRFAVTQAALLAANNLTDANAIVVGQTLTIPDSGGTTTTMTNKASSGVQVSRTTSQTYTVQAGDSLSAIAVRFGVTQAALLAANKLTDANSIIVGQTLTIPGGNQTMSTQAAAPQTQTYVVQAGDTLSAIALRFNVTQAALLAANHLTNANSIIVGQTLTIPASSQTFAPSDSR